MTETRTRLAAVIAILFLIVPAAAGAQNLSLHQGGNHMAVGSDVSLIGFETFNVAIGTAYSIAGVLDIGFVYATPLVVTGDLWSQIGLSYAVTPIRQSETVPVSLQIYGSYVFRSVQSDFLSDNRLIREGQGYDMGFIISRRIALLPWLSLGAGVLAEYQRRTETTSLAFVYNPDTFVGEPDVDYGEYPVIDRTSSLSFGPRLAFTVPIPGAHSAGFTLAMLFDQLGGMILRPGIHAAFVR